MKNKWFKIGLGATVASVIAAGTIFVAAPALAQGSTTATSPNAITQDRGPRGGGMRGGAMHSAAIAKALNMTEADLKTEVESGKSIADIASAKGVSLDTIINAIIADETTQLKQAVTDGRFTQAQADTLLANLKLTLPTQLQTKWVGMPQGAAGQGGKRGGPMAGPQSGAQLATVAKALNITEDELRTELQAGKSIADVAAEKDVAISTVVDAVIAEQETALKQAVTDGKLTQAQADQRLALLKTNLPTLFQLKGEMGGGFGGPGRGQRGGGRGNQTPNQNTPTPAPSTTSATGDVTL